MRRLSSCWPKGMKSSRRAFTELVVNAYAGEKRVIELQGAYHNDPIEGTALADLNDTLGWLLPNVNSQDAPKR